VFNFPKRSLPHLCGFTTRLLKSSVESDFLLLHVDIAPFVNTIKFKLILTC
jgi:hypothetical protein